ncbi:transmembrane protein 179-like [Babylonia areolata]|uniref:transmembrane protein 179-like n=1 Tax=Babylonia areolata TaxID=304850 RepID=UPI003FD1853C
MPVVIDFHVLAQAVVYFISVVCGFVIAIPLGVTTRKLNGQCLLFTDITWTGHSRFQPSFSAGSMCYFPVYLAVAVGIVFAAGMGVYYVYAATRKDPDTGSRMWVFPFTLISSVSAVTFLVAASIISAGFQALCDQYTKGEGVESCKEFDHVNWNDSKDSSSAYEHLKISEGAAWVMVLVWLVQVGLGILRIVRNRRLRSQGSSNPGNSGNVVGKSPTA